MSKTEDRLIVPEKMKSLKDYNDLLIQIANDNEKKCRDLEIRRESMIITLKQLDDDRVSRQAAFEQQTRLEEQRLKRLKEHHDADVMKRMYAADIAEKEMNNRLIEINRREGLAIKIVEKETQLNKDRLQVEQMFSRANSMLADAEKKQEMAERKFEQSNQRDNDLITRESKVAQKEDSVIQRDNAVTEKLKMNESILKNIEEVRKAIDPKITELQKLEKGIALREKDVQEREEKVHADEHNIKEITISLENKSNKLKDRENALTLRELEINRKLLLTEGK